MMSRLSKCSRRLVVCLLRRSDGAAAVEFALCLPILLMAILGAIEFGRVMWTQNALHYAVQQAARCYSINNASVCTSVSTTQTYAAATAGYAFDPSIFTVTTAVCGKQVSASYTFQFLTSLVNIAALTNRNLTLTAQSCFPI
jgi:Flp pilus assembly protein TadG